MVKLELKKAIGAAVFSHYSIPTRQARGFSSLVEDYGATVVNITGERISGNQMLTLFLRMILFTIGTEGSVHRSLEGNSRSQGVRVLF